jgi:hypothetical protein
MTSGTSQSQGQFAGHQKSLAVQHRLLLPAGVSFEIEFNTIKPFTMDLISEIRRENGFDRVFDSLETISTVRALQGNLNRGLQK